MKAILAVSILVLLCSAVFSQEFDGITDDDFFGGLFRQHNFHFKSAINREAEKPDSSEEAGSANPESLDIDTISGTISGSNINIDSNEKPATSDSSAAGDVFDHSLGPFAANPLFGLFGPGLLFPGFNIPRAIPWWRGPNVCTEKKEEISDWYSSSAEGSDENSTALRQSHIGIHFSLNSCAEKTNKRICTTVVDENGRKKTVSITYQCCRGFGRKKNSKSSNIQMPCEELHLRSLIETSERLDGREFIRSAQKNDIDEKLRKNVTLFMPTDKEFTEFAEQLLESNLVVLPGSRARRQAASSSITTKAIILNHIVPEIIDIEDVENEQLLVTDYENATIRMNIFPRPLRFNSRNDDDSPYMYTANCAPITKANQEAENGIVHVIDRVLMPVTSTLMQLIRDRGDMAVLQTVLDKTDLAKQLANSEKQFTLFAPTDKAFEKLEPHLRRAIKDGKGCALNILKNHILDMTFCSAAVFEGAKTNVLNKLGERMMLELKEQTKKESDAENVTPSEVEDLVGKKLITIDGKAQIVEPDVMATNGVMHVIDALLPTDSSLPLTSMLESRNLTYFKMLLELNGIDEIVDSYENVTCFAPTNEALESNEWMKKLESDPSSLKDNEELTKFLQYHIAKPLVKTCDLTERSLNTEAGENVRINLYSTHSILSNVFNRATVNCARLVHFDDDSCGSVLHQIDRPLEKPTQNLFEKLKSNEQYSMFTSLIEKANLTSLLENANRSLTVLVPKDDVFTEVKEYFDKLAADSNSNKLENLIKSHIIDDGLCCAGIVQSEWPFMRLVKTINDVDLRLNRDRRPKIQNAGVTKCDIIATNGIIHEINDVINTKNVQRTPATRTKSDEDDDDDDIVFPFPKRTYSEFLFK